MEKLILTIKLADDHDITIGADVEKLLGNLNVERYYGNDNLNGCVRDSQGRVVEFWRVV